MKIFYSYLVFVFILFGFVFLQRDYISKKIERYSYNLVEQSYGTKKLDPQLEEKIIAIAHKMGVFEPILIRKMNSNALRLFGYYNAYACFPLLFNFIPVGSKPFLFVSEGFFEDLSPEEQVFLIGHEMVHIKERHTLYLNLIFYILLLGFFLLWLLLKKLYKTVVNKNSLIKKYSFVFGAVHILLLFIFLVSPNLICLAYRRHIERVADYKSMEILKSYDGGIKLLERWKQKFEILDHNPFHELLSDHPSNIERKQYCLEFKNKTERHHEKHEIA